MVASSSRACSIDTPAASSASAYKRARWAADQVRAGHERREHVRIEERHPVRRGQHADDGVGLTVDYERRAEYVLRAEGVSPVAIRDHGDQVARLTFGGRERPALRDRQVHHLEQAGRHRGALGHRGLSGAGDDAFERVEPFEPGEGAGTLAQARHFHLLQRVSLQRGRGARRLRKQVHDLAARGERQWPEHRGVDHGEERCVGAEHQGQRGRAGHEIGPAMPQRAPGLAQLADKCPHARTLPARALRHLVRLIHRNMNGIHGSRVRSGQRGEWESTSFRRHA